MVVVSDTSAISNLLQIGQIDLLRALYGNVVISPAVQRELYYYGQHSEQIEKLAWLEVKYPKNQALIQELLKDLDLGESESIVLAIEENANYLVIDEYMGRRIAHSMNVKVVGILGVLILARRKRVLTDVRSSIKSLLSLGFRLNSELINSVLRELGEKEI